MRGLTRDAELFDIALNRLTNNSTGVARFGEEFAGATFGPGTDTLDSDHAKRVRDRRLVMSRSISSQ